MIWLLLLYLQGWTKEFPVSPELHEHYEKARKIHLRVAKVQQQLPLLYSSNLLLSWAHSTKYSSQFQQHCTRPDVAAAS